MKASQQDQPNPRGGPWPAALPPPRRDRRFLAAPLALLLFLILFLPALPAFAGACIDLKKSVSGNGPGGPFVRNSVTSANPNPNAANPLIASVPGTNNIPAPTVDIPTAFFGGTPVFYQFKITNCGNVDLYNVRLDDCIDRRSVGADGFLLGGVGAGGEGNCEQPRMIPASPQRIVANKLTPGQSVTVTSTSFTNDPINPNSSNFIDICNTYGRLRTNGIVRNDAEAEADADTDGNGSGDKFVFFDELNLVQCKPTPLGDRVWEDKNGNGQQDCTYTPAGFTPTASTPIPGPNATCAEPGIPGVTVKLVDCTTGADIPGVSPVTTGANGFYRFTNLTPAAGGTQYCVKFDQSTAPNYCAQTYPSGPGGALQFTKKNVGDPLTDSNADPMSGLAAPVTLLPGQTNLSIDAGLYCPVALGDTVWNDTNKNGIQDNLNQQNGEPGINNLAVELYDCSGNPVSLPPGQNPTTTGPAPANASSPQVANGAGWYGFTGLAPGCYQVKFTKPANFAFSPQNQGGDTALDSNPIPATGITGQVNLVSGDYNPTIDAGVYELPPPQKSSLGNFFWHDLNANGIQDTNEPGINNVPVALLNGSCQPFSPPITQNTAGGGIYNFTNLQAGDYCVQFGKPVNFCQFGSSGTPTFSPEKAPGSTPTDDSNAKLTTGLTGKISLPANTDDPTWDAGVYCPAKLGNFVWQDCNQNGIQDDALIVGCTYGGGYPNVPVKLLDCSGNPANDVNGNPGVTTTDTNGLYSFLVKPGSYIVEFTKPNDTVFTTPFAGNDPAIDSNANQTTGRTECTFVPSNTNNPTLDAGVYPPTQPKVTLEKFTNGYDGDNAAGAPTITPPNGLSLAGDNRVAVVAPGASVTWTYQVTNIGNEQLSNIVVTDPRATAQGATIICPGTGNNTVTSLAVGASVSCTATLTARSLVYGPPDVVAGCSDGNKIPPSPTYENIGTVTAKGQFSQTSVSDDDPSHYCNPVPGVKLVKFTNGYDANILNGNPTTTPPNGSFTEGGTQVPQVSVGGVVTWTYRVTNTGNEPLTNVTVTDPAATAQTAVITCPGGSNTIASLPVGQSVDCVATLPGGAKLLTLGGNVYDGCGNEGFNRRPTYENTGYVSGAGQLSRNSVSDADLSHYCNPPGGNYTLTKTPKNATYNLGDNISFTMVVTSTGPGTAQNVVLNDPLPTLGNLNSWTITSNPGGCSIAADNKTLTCSFGDLANGQSRTVTVATNASGGANATACPGGVKLNNTATVTSTGLPTKTDTGDYTCTPPPPSGSFTLTKTPKNATYNLGDNISFTMVVTSTGPGTAQNVVLNDPLPTLGNLNSWTITSNPGGCSIAADNKTLTCSFGDLANGQSRTVTVATNASGGANATACPGGVKLNNTATVTSNGLPPKTDTGDYLCTPSVCALTVEKTCQIPPPPSTTTFTCSTDITSISMIWNGSQTVNVQAYYGKVGASTLLKTINGVKVGDEVTVSGYANSGNDVEWEIFSAATGQSLGKSTFHLSCSDGDMDGEISNRDQQQLPGVTNDCGKNEGNGKGLTGFLDTWKFAGMVDSDETLDCTPTPTTPSEACTLTPTGTPSCETLDAKPKELTFQYTGGGCSKSNNDQAAGKAVCTPSPAGSVISGTITVVYAGGNSDLKKDPYTAVPTTVNPDGSFTISFNGADLKADSYINMCNSANVCELNKIHTSCSQPLAVGNVFGSLTLVGFNGQTAGNNVTYGYKVTNNGDLVNNISLVDNKLGAISSQPFSLAKGASQTFSKAASLTATTTNTATASGTLVSGAACSASDSVTVTVQPPSAPFVCSDAKPITSMVVEWNGTQNPIYVKMWNGSVGTGTPTLAGPTAPGQDVTFTRTTASTPNDIYFQIYTDSAYTQLLGTSTFHLSCSDADMNGSDDCGKAAGNGKTTSTSFINTWLFEGMGGNGLTLTCP